MADRYTNAEENFSFVVGIGSEAAVVAAEARVKELEADNAALRKRAEDAEADNAELRAEVERMRPVVEAAIKADCDRKCEECLSARMGEEGEPLCREFARYKLCMTIRAYREGKA